MDELTIDIQTPDGMVLVGSKIPNDYTTEQIIEELVDVLELPRVSEVGRPINYSLISVKQNIALLSGHTLAQLGIEKDDTIRLASSEAQLEKQIPEYTHEYRKPAESAFLRQNKVFLVHGRDVQTRQLVERFLRDMELEIVILANQPNRGMSIIEKFENYAGNVSYAVILMTPDDAGGFREETTNNLRQQERARQNVIFELGYFAGRLGRGKICLLRKGDVEMPSDLHGVVYIDIDENNNWSWSLADELIAVGLIKRSHAYGACRYLLSGNI